MTADTPRRAGKIRFNLLSRKEQYEKRSSFTSAKMILVIKKPDITKNTSTPI